MDGGGHYALIVARQEKLRAFQASRGMSAGALARLPQSPPPGKPPVLRAVLATRHDALKVDWASMTREDRRLYRDVAFIREVKATPLDFGIKWSRQEADPADIARAKAIVREVARLARLEPYQIFARGRGYRYSLPRQTAIYLVLSLVKLPLRPTAELFNYRDSSGAHYAAKRCRHRLARGDRQMEVFYHDALRAVQAKLAEAA